MKELYYDLATFDFREGTPILSRWPQKCRADWDVSFSDGVTYRCDSNTYIENDGIDKNDAEIQVDCIDFVGEYNTSVKQGESWPIVNSELRL